MLVEAQSDLLQAPNLALDQLLVPSVLPSDSHSVLQALLRTKSSQIHTLKTQLEELVRAHPFSIEEKIANIESTIAQSPSLQLFQ